MNCYHCDFFDSETNFCRMWHKKITPPIQCLNEPTEIKPKEGK